MQYDGHVAVRDVGFQVNAGDYLCIVGENGSGKSTLIKGILGLIRPLRGTFAFDGVKQTEIGYLPQQTAAQADFPASVYEVVLSGCLNRRGLKPFYSTREKDRALGNIRLLGIEPIYKKSYRELSGGQQRRVLLARALCATEKLLLLDEPAAGLDPVVTGELYTIIEKLNREREVTVIMVSHDMQMAIRYGNKILHMQTHAAFFGSTQEYKETGAFRRMMGEYGND
jgi:zinc transport system ATP-binding protein